ncbi:hypothetical protein [Salibacter halophilus]|uniref:Lipoprotein n=1 Tax=Salibacter halophilus TaxID=1803916 RepID=A0A6N6M9B4_9FLAO|nr:hypothetical protein [Salibacter halophilus]KAB1065575.1 hypothetical protein F3059_02675 [Salibacter halophilus]
MKNHLNLFAILVLSIFFLGCSQLAEKKKDKPVKQVNLASELNEHVSNSNSDSTSNPLSYHYLADKDLKKVARWIVSDSIEPADNKVTFSILNSISDSNKATRDYYFPAYLAIVKKSDGALAQIIGSYSLRYIKEYPVEFFERIKCDKGKECGDLLNVASSVQYEIEMGQNPIQEFAQLRRLINEKTSESDKDVKKKVKRFLGYIEIKKV